MRHLMVLTAILAAVALTISGALWATHTWSIETVDDPDTPAVGDRSCIVLDGSGYPHISYAADSTTYDLKYAFWDGSQWVIETADSAKVGAGAYTSIDLGPTGKPHISYCQRGGTWDNLRYARRDGTNTWFTETVDGGYGDTLALTSSIGVDSTGTVHIAYSDSTDDDLEYAVGTGGSWTLQTLDSADDVGGPCWLDLDSSGQPHIVYFDNTNDGLKYVWRNGLSWESRPGISNGAWPRLALDSSDTPHIAYFDRTTRAVEYAVWNGMSWDTATVDGAANTYAAPGIGIGPGGGVHIAYCVGSMGDLKLAVKNGGTWEIEVVDDCGQVWRNLSVAVGSASDPRVSYTRFDTKGLWYATGAPLAVRWPR